MAVVVVVVVGMKSSEDRWSRQFSRKTVIENKKVKKQNFKRARARNRHNKGKGIKKKDGKKLYEKQTRNN